MSLWSYVDVKVNTTEICSKAEFLNVFNRFSDNFIGSEGGVTLRFVDGNYKSDNLNRYERKKNKVGIKLENYNELTEVIIKGSLRDVSNVDQMVANLHTMYQIMKENSMVTDIMGVVRNDMGESYRVQGKNCDVYNEETNEHVVIDE